VIVHNSCDFQPLLFRVHVAGEMNANSLLMTGKSVVCLTECVGVFHSICDRGIFSKSLVAVKTAVCLLSVLQAHRSGSLTAESVEGTSLSLQSVDNVHGCDGLSLGMLCVCDCITDDVLEEDFQDTTGFLVDESRDTFNSTSTCKTTDGRLGDTLDVVSKNFPVTLGAPLSKTFSSFTTTRHVYVQ